MHPDVDIFRWLGDDYLIPFLRSVGRGSHLSVGPEFIKSLAGGLAVDPASPGATWSTHDETIARARELGSRLSTVVYLDHRDEQSARARLKAALPSSRLISLLFDVMPQLSVGQPSDAANDDPPAEPPLRYAILCPPRSGSYYLCDLLASSGCGMPGEHIRPAHCHLANYPSFDPKRFLRAMMTRGAAQSVFGTKIISNFFAQFFRILPEAPQAYAIAAETLRSLGFQMIRLRRSDLVAQAVSKYVAAVTAEYRLSQARGATRGQPPYDREAIAACVSELFEEEKKLDRFFSAFGTHHTLTYESLEADPIGEIGKVLAFLGRPREAAQNARSSLVRQRTELTETYARRFRLTTSRAT